MTREDLIKHFSEKRERTTYSENFEGYRAWKEERMVMRLERHEIKNVIVNPPATIVFWDDGTKTVVKAFNEHFDPEKGIAMAYVKKHYAGDSYYNMIKKWAQKYGDAEEKEPKRETIDSERYLGFCSVCIDREKDVSEDPCNAYPLKIGKLYR